MEELTSEDLAGPSNVEDREDDGTSKGRTKGVPLSQACYKRSKTIGNAATAFSGAFPRCNMCIMVGSTARENAWYVSELRQVSNDPVWQTAMKTFIETQFSKKERDSDAMFVIPDSNSEPADHEKALSLAVKKGVLSEYQYKEYLKVLAEVKKGKGKREIHFLRSLISSSSDIRNISCPSSPAAGAVSESTCPRLILDFAFFSGHRQ